MLLSREVKVRWNSANKKHYIAMGYKFTRLGDEFEALVIDATKGSNSYVNVECDYCGKCVEKALYHFFNDREKTIKKDACKDCCQIKKDEVVAKKYGVVSTQQIPEVKNKTKKTMVERYGAENFMQSEYAYDVCKESHFEKYQKWYVQTLEFQEKTKSTNIERYGAKWYLASDESIEGRTGEKHHNWKGGVPYNDPGRTTPEYRRWRKLVCERDEFTCQKCGSNDNIHVHHIFNFSTYEDLRTRVDNGIVLCARCHRRFHSRFGNENTNSYQMQEFLLTYGKNIV